MKVKTHIVISILLWTVACGPSPEATASMTAPSWTETPSATSTPLPYDLTVVVTDENGAPLEGAFVVIPEIDESFTVDASGEKSWKDLPITDVSFLVTAQGYLPYESEVSLTPGSNEIEVIPEPYPYGTLAEPCAQGQVLFIEDFQDGEAQDLIPLRGNGNDLGPGWHIESVDAGNPNIALIWRPTEENHVLDQFNDAYYAPDLGYMSKPLDDATISLDVKVNSEYSFVFLAGQENPRETTYGIGLHPEADQIQVYLFSWDSEDTDIPNGPFFAHSYQPWHHLEVSVSLGSIQGLFDGQNAINWQDATPLMPLILGIGDNTAPIDIDTQFFQIDNIIVCQNQ